MPKEINISDTEKKEKPQVKVEKKVEIKPQANTQPKTDALKKEQPLEKKNITPTEEPESNDKEKKSSKPTKEKKKITFKQLILPIVAVLTLLGIASFYYFGIYKVKPTSPSDVVPFSENFISSLKELKTYISDLTLLSEPAEPRTEESPLNGLLFTKSEMDVLMNRRPVAVMINNHAIARPQSGLNSADIVYETNVESGITRYMAIFWSKAPSKVGPIRSIRNYYLEWISEYDPIVIHDGCASSDDPRVNACGNIYTYGLKDIATAGAWRWDDGRRYAPHNEYSSVTYAWEYAQRMNWDSFPTTVGDWNFKSDAAISDRGEEKTISAIFHERLDNGGAYDTTWTYDNNTNSYFRKVGGLADVDQETNTQVRAKNVVIQEVDMINTFDTHAHIIIETIDEGDAIILQDGKIIYGSWEKSSRTDRTKYYDNNGDPISFNRGLIWIAAIPQSEGKFAIIEQ